MNFLLAFLQALVLITTPISGDTVVGTLTITGTAASPQFDHYETAFAYDPNTTDTWFEIAPPSTTPVTSGPLASWDTSNITDGVYMIRLRVYSTDSKAPVEVIVRNIKVSNSSPTAVPGAPTTAPGEATSVSPDLTPAADATTAIDLTPAGATPQATVPGQEPTAALTATPEATSTPTGLAALPAFLNLSSYASAFCNGVYLTAAVFLVLGVYVVVRDRIRRPIRKWLRRVVSDIRKP